MLTTAPTGLDHDLTCVTCGYNLRGLRRDGRCPECGGTIARSIEEAQRGVTLAELRAARRVCRALLIACCGAIVVALTAFNRPWSIFGVPILGEIVAWAASLTSLWFAAPLLRRTSIGRKALMLSWICAIAALAIVNVMLRLMQGPSATFGPAVATLVVLISASNIVTAPVPLLAVVDTLRRDHRERALCRLAALVFAILFATTLADLGCETVIFGEVQRMPGEVFALTMPHPGIGYAVIWPIATAAIIGGRFVMSPIEYGLVFGEMIARPAWIIVLVVISVAQKIHIRRREARGERS